MEALVEFLPLLFIILYYFVAGRRRAKLRKEAARRQAQAAEGQPIGGDGSATEAEASPFQQFLEQLEDAIAEAEGKKEPVEIAPPAPPPLPTQPPDVIPPQPTVRRPVVSVQASEFRALEGSFDDVAPTDHEAHGFGVENPLSEEVFEQSPVFAQRAPRSRSHDPHGLRPRRPATRGTSWRRQLEDPDAAKDAFVLQTIFGKRGGRRGL